MAGGARAFTWWSAACLNTHTCTGHRAWHSTVSIWAGVFRGLADADARWHGTRGSTARLWLQALAQL